MHFVNRCLKNMLLSIQYQDISPQGACPPVCNGTRWTGSSAAPGASFPLTSVWKLLLPSA